MTIMTLYVDEQGLAHRREMDTDDLTPTDQIRRILGWDELDGPAQVCTGPAVGEYLRPIRTT